jgi:hypothetical protein
LEDIPDEEEDSEADKEEAFTEVVREGPTVLDDRENIYYDKMSHCLQGDWHWLEIAKKQSFRGERNDLRQDPK